MYFEKNMYVLMFWIYNKSSKVIVIQIFYFLSFYLLIFRDMCIFPCFSFSLSLIKYTKKDKIVCSPLTPQHLEQCLQFAKHTIKHSVLCYLSWKASFNTFKLFHSFLFYLIWVMTTQANGLNKFQTVSSVC